LNHNWSIFRQELSHFFIRIYIFFNITSKFVWNFSIFLPELRYFGRKWTILQFKVQMLSGISRFFDKNWHIFYLKCSVFQINSKFESQLIDILPEMANFLNWIYQFSDITSNLSEIYRFFCRNGRHFARKWTILV